MSTCRADIPVRRLRPTNALCEPSQTATPPSSTMAAARVYGLKYARSRFLKTDFRSGKMALDTIYPTSKAEKTLEAAKKSRKSLFMNIFHVSPLSRIFCSEVNDSNRLKMGGEGVPLGCRQ
jgi:hypothetical protein